MALSIILRRSMPTLASAGPRIVRSQKEKHLLSSPLMKPVLSSVSPFHYYSSSAGAKKTQFEDTLIRYIEARIECKQGDDGEPVNFPFEIKANILGQVSLRRKCYGETIKISAAMVHKPVSGKGCEDRSCLCHFTKKLKAFWKHLWKWSEDNGDENEMGSESSINMTVRINNVEYDSLVIRCTFSADEIAICSVAVNWGPYISDMDENLQKALHKYLKMRGINHRTATFLREYMYMTSKRDNKRYLMFLEELKRFFQAK
ncbi:hypothetical protein QQ045_017055 [Rhodiola kirilowii]